MKKLLYNIAFSLVSVSLVLLIGELILASAHNLTHNAKFSTLINEDLKYPKNSEDYLKIAIFGGSAAFGYNSERSLSDILSYVLKKQYPQTKFYIKNYAQCGYPFHRHQAEILKGVIDKYDIFLIYTGNNEAYNYIDDIGYFRTAKYKSWKTLKQVQIRNKDAVDAFAQFINYNSRVYAVAQKGYNKYIQPFLVKTGKGQRIYQTKKFKEFESEKVLPREEIQNLSTNFKNDLEEIAVLAKGHEKYIIISIIPTNGSYKPFFSVHKPGLNGKEIEIFHNNYELGLEKYKKHQFNEAISYFTKALEVDGRVAILNYLIGQSYLNIGNREKARSFIQASIDNDGYPCRSLSSYHKIAAKIAQEYENIYYIDTEQIFYKLLDGGFTYKELFSDLHHPSLIGHFVVAHSVLSKMPKPKPLMIYSSKELCIEPSELRALVSSLKHELGVSVKDESQTAFMISRWHISMASISFYPEDYLSVAEDRIGQYYEKSDKTPSNKALMLLFIALIEAKRGNSTHAAQIVNQVLKLAPAYVRGSLYRDLGTGERALDVLSEAGISLSEDKFILADSANNN